jgi:hypothetical protein
MPKYSTEDTTLPAVRPDGSIGSVPVPKGTKLIFSSVGLHYNREFYHIYTLEDLFISMAVARYWKDPYAFNPSRFLGDWNKDAFVPFSAGKRRSHISRNVNFYVRNKVLELVSVEGQYRSEENDF